MLEETGKILSHDAGLGRRGGGKKAVTGDEIDDPSGHYPQDRDYYPQF